MTRAKLVELYVNQRLTTKQLGAAIGVSQPTAVRYLKAWRIPARKSGNAPVAHCRKCEAPTHRQKHCSAALCYQHFRERENARHRARRRSLRRTPRRPQGPKEASTGKPRSK